MACKTDIAKMLRQIRFHPDDTDLQKIFWTFNPNETLSVFRLSTVPCVTAPAPFSLFLWGRRLHVAIRMFMISARELIA